MDIYFNLIIMCLTTTQFSIQHSHVMAPKLFIYFFFFFLLYTTASLITQYVSMDLKHSVIMRMTCVTK